MNSGFLSSLTSFILLLMPSWLMAQSLPAKQRSPADTIAYIIQHTKKAENQCDALFEMGKHYFNAGDDVSTYLTMRKCLEIAKTNHYEKRIYDSYAVLGSVYLKRADFDSSRFVFQQCLQLANLNHSDYGSNRAYYLLANIYYQKSLLDSVIFICKKVLETPRTIFDSVNLPRFNAFLGNAYLGKGDFQNANICYIEALRLAEMMHDEPLAGVCLGNLSVINSELRNYRDAIKYQRRAADIAQKNNQVQQLGTVYLAMGTSYRELMALDSAIYYYRKSLELSRQFGLIDDIAICHSNLGAILVSTNQLDSGLYYMQLAKTEFASQSDSLDVASNALTMGWVWRALAFVKNNKSYLQNARSELLLCKSIAEQKDISDLRMKCYKELSVLEETMGHPVQAFEYLKQYSAISDSTRGQQYTKQIAEMQTQYQSEKKELEITKLNTEKQLGIEKIARQRVLNFSLLSIAGLLLISGSFIYRNIQKKRVAEQHVALLEKQNAIESMRSKIASDVHDEMGANLTRLGLNAQQLLQSPAIPENEKLLAEKMASQSKDILTGMREIIWASNPANDNLKSMLGFMRQFIDRFFDGTQIRPVVNFPHNIGEVTLHPEVRRNLFLILKESLNNALKYSGSDRIDIDFHNENENYQLTIKDYGKGLEDEEKNDFSSGLHNMQMRAEQIKSFFRLLTGPGQGVQIMVEGKLY